MTIIVLERKACARDQNLDQQGFPVLHRRGKVSKRSIEPLFGLSGDFLPALSLKVSKAVSIALTRQQLNKLFSK